MKKEKILGLVMAGLMGISVAVTAAEAWAAPAAGVQTSIQTSVQTSVQSSMQSYGAVNWEGGSAATVEATGTGLPPVNMPPNRGTVMARRAAIVDCYRLLAETVQGVQVNAQSTVQDMALVSDVVRTSVNALIQGAKIVEEQVGVDGSYSVKMSVPLYGARSLAAVTLPMAMQEQSGPGMQNNQFMPVPAVKPLTPAVPLQPRTGVSGMAEQNYAQAPYGQVAPNMQAVPNMNMQGMPNMQAAPNMNMQGMPNMQPAPVSPGYAAPQNMPVMNAPGYNALAAEQQVVYTGVIIDASGLGMEGAFSPAIYDINGRVIYGVQELEANYAVNQGMVEYAADVYSASSASRAGVNPLVIKALALGGGSVPNNKINVTISVEDADQILQANVKNGFLQQHAVVFVK